MLKKKGVLRLIYEKNKPLPRLMSVFIKERFLTGATIAELGLCLLYKLKLNKSILKCSFSEQRCKPLQKKSKGLSNIPEFLPRPSFPLYRVFTHRCCKLIQLEQLVQLVARQLGRAWEPE